MEKSFEWPLLIRGGGTPGPPSPIEYFLEPRPLLLNFIKGDSENGSDVKGAGAWAGTGLAMLDFVWVG